MSFLIAPSKELPGALSGQFFCILNHTSNGLSCNHIVAIELDKFQDQEFNDNHVAISINSLVSVKSAPAGYFLNEYVEFKNLSLASVELTQVWVGKHAHDAHIVSIWGYIAPELAKSGKATTSTYIIHLGFCLEVACGRRPVEPHASPKEVIMENWVYECLREGKILSTRDPKLNKNFNAEEVELVLKLGQIICSHNLAEIRPKMLQVLIYLKGDAFLLENFNTRIQELKYRGESDSHAISHGSMPSLIITESLQWDIDYANTERTSWLF
ncbi:hypothetical protein GH714_014487 [Hevea brasiliensis]|uniref:BRCT domain-containing protein n=1 Tax=Hevea brasiliensis TaxID=3981 RepID=A0A6A6LRV4_HEVBR|nr:hypothetical protein GH714_014487 [Hevea brasiliensis]